MTADKEKAPANSEDEIKEKSGSENCGNPLGIVLTSSTISTLCHFSSKTATDGMVTPRIAANLPIFVFDNDNIMSSVAMPVSNACQLVVAILLNKSTFEV